MRTWGRRLDSEADAAASRPLLPVSPPGKAEPLVRSVLALVPQLDGSSCDLLSGFCLMGWLPPGSFPSLHRNPGEPDSKGHGQGKLDHGFRERTQRRQSGPCTGCQFAGSSARGKAEEGRKGGRGKDQVGCFVPSPLHPFSHVHLPEGLPLCSMGSTVPLERLRFPRWDRVEVLRLFSDVGWADVNVVHKQGGPSAVGPDWCGHAI